MVGEGSQASVRNSVFWGNGNPDSAPTLADQYILYDGPYFEQATVRFENSVVQGSGGSGSAWTPSISGDDPRYGVAIDDGGNLDADPLFESAGVATGAPFVAGTTLDYRLAASSPAEDAGTLPLPLDAADLDENGLIGEPLPFDLAGADRLQGNVPDIGAYESVFIAPPTASDDFYVGRRDETLIVSASNGVLSNDTDNGARPTRAVVGTGPATGVLTFASDGGFSYEPVAGFVGVETFTYRALGPGGPSAVATVSLSFEPPPAAPVARPDSYAGGVEDTPFSVAAAAGVLANDTEGASRPAGASLVLPLPANVQSVDLAADGAFTLTPTADSTGALSFRYHAVGVEGRSSDTVEVIVAFEGTPDAPRAQDDTFGLGSDQRLIVTDDVPPQPWPQGTIYLDAATVGLLANDEEPDGEALTVEIVTPPTRGTFALTNAATGAFEYDPTYAFDRDEFFVRDQTRLPHRRPDRPRRYRSGRDLSRLRQPATGLRATRSTRSPTPRR